MADLIKSGTQITAKGILEIDPPIGSSFVATAQRAKSDVLREGYSYAEYKFNGVICHVSKDTNIDLLERDYHLAHKLDLKVIGPHCQEVLPQSVLDTIIRVDTENEKRWAIEAEESRQEQARKLKALNDKIESVPFFERQDKLGGFEQWKTKQEDAYSMRVMTYADEWARLMQYEMSTGKTLADVAYSASCEADYDSITGFMFGAARSVLIQTWFYGKQLAQVYNMKTGLTV